MTLNVHAFLWRVICLVPELSIWAKRAMNPGTLKIQYCCKVLQISYTKCSIEQIVHSCAHLDYIFLFLQIKKYA